MINKRIHYAISYCDLTFEFQKYVDDGTLLAYQVTHHAKTKTVKEHYHNILVPAKPIDWNKLHWELHEFPLMNFVPMI